MTHRDRVRLVLQHKEPDRVPVDLWGSASRIHNNLYKRLAKHFGFEQLGPRPRKGKTTEYVDYRISDVFDCDFRHINAGGPQNFKSYTDDQGNVIDEWGIGRKNFNGFAGITKHPLQEADLDDLKKFNWPDPYDPGRIEGVKEQAKEWFENTDYSISSTTVVSGLHMELAQFLRGTTEFLTDLYINKKFAHYLIEKLNEIFIQMYSFYLEPIGKYLDWVEFTEDFGMQDRPIIPDSIFKEFFFKPHKEFFRSIKKVAPNAKIFLHSCGSIREFIPSFIEMGVEILNSLQPRAAGMDSFELKKDFGDSLIFHGGIDIQEALRGTKQEAIDETKKRIDAFGPGGGYILSPSNHFIDDIPEENIIAVYETAVEYGRYPIKQNIH